MQRGEFKSLDFDGALERLEEIDVNLDDTDVTHLRDLRNLRHKVEHFALSMGREQIISLLAKGCHFVIDFCRRELPEEMSEHERMFDEIMGHLREFDVFREHALIIGDANPHCPFCGYRTSVEELADLITEAARGVCPECDEDACVIVIYNNDEAGWFCVACGTRAEHYETCSRCGRLIRPDDDPCGDCWRELMERD